MTVDGRRFLEPEVPGEKISVPLELFCADEEDSFGSLDSTPRQAFVGSYQHLADLRETVLEP